MSLFILNDDSFYNHIDEIVESFLAEIRAGESPSIDAYVNKHPRYGIELRGILETLRIVKPSATKLSETTIVSLDGETKSSSSLTFLQIDDFEIEHKIGEGGMGVVYCAFQKSLQRRVAMKVIPQALLADELAVRRFELEARTAAKLQHSHIVPVFDVGHSSGVYYYTMQLIDGCGMDVIIKRIRKERDAIHEEIELRGWSSHSIKLVDYVQDDEIAYVPTSESRRGSGTAKLRAGESNWKIQSRGYFEEVAELGYQVALALSHSHEMGIVHRDIKPSNLILDRSGHVWITDFGLAKTEESELTRTGDIVGTLRFMSPERMDGICDRRSDIYALGMTLYEILTLEPALRGAGQLAIIQQIRNEAPRPLRGIEAGIPRDLETIIDKAIRKEPESRYQTAIELAEDLHSFLMGLPIKARRVGRVERLAKWSSRNPVVAGAVATIALLLILLSMGSVFAAIRFRTMAINEGQLRYMATRAEQEQREAMLLAQEKSSENLRNLYYAEMKLAMDAAGRPTGLTRLRELLSHWVPAENSGTDAIPEDLRGFEWYWLAALASPNPARQIEFLYPLEGTQLALHPTEPLVVFGYGNLLIVADWESQEVVMERELAANVWSVSLSRRGERLAVVMSNGEVFWIDLASGKEQGSQLLSGANCIAWAGNDRQLWVGRDRAFDGSTEPIASDRIAVIDTESGKVLREMIPGADFEQCELGELVAAKWNGEQVAVSIQQNATTGVIFFDAVSGKVLGRRQWTGHPARLMAWSPYDGRLAVATFDRRLTVVDADEASYFLQESLESRPSSLVWSQNGRELALGAAQGAFRIVDARDLNMKAHYLISEGTIRFACQDRMSGRLLSFTAEEGFCVWNEYELAQRMVQNIEPGDTESRCTVSWSASGEKLLFGNDVVLTMRNIADDRIVHERGEGYSILGDFLGWKGEAGIVSSYRTKVTIRDAYGAKVVDEFFHDERGGVDHVQRVNTDPSGERLLLKMFPLGEKWGMQTIDLRSQELHTLVPETQGHWSADPVWSGDGKRIAVGINRQLKVLDAQTGELQAEMTLASDVQSIAWHPTGKQLAASDESQEIVVFNCQTGEESMRLRGHTGKVFDIDWSPQGTRMASVSDDESLILWDVVEQRPIVSWRGDLPIRAVRWSPDGKRLAMVDQGGKGIILDASRSYGARLKLSKQEGLNEQ